MQLKKKTQLEVFPLAEVQRGDTKTRSRFREDIVPYGADNLYPDKMELLAQQSPQASSSLSLLFDYLFGFGFADQYDDIVVNRRGDTLYDVAYQLVKDFTTYQGFALHFNYDLTLQKSECTAVPFKRVRMGERNNSGVVPYYYVHDDWATESATNPATKYYKYLSSDVDVEHQIMHAGGIDSYPGQLLYFTPQKDIYPLTTFDPITPAVVVDAEVQLYKVNDVKSGFNTSVVFKDPNQYDDSPEGEEMMAGTRELIKDMSGNSQKLFWLRGIDPAHMDKSIFEILNIPELADRFAYTEKTSKEAIIDHFKQPRVLFSMFEGSALGQSATIYQEASRQYTRNTIRQRNRLSKGLGEVVKKFPLLENIDTTLEGYHDGLYSNAEDVARAPVPGDSTDA